MSCSDLSHTHCGVCGACRRWCPHEATQPPAAAGPEPMPERFIMPVCGHGATLAELRALLATQGRAIVPTAEVVTAEERRVLDAMAGVALESVKRAITSAKRSDKRRVWRAELARRAAKADDAEKSRRETGDW